MRPSLEQSVTSLIVTRARADSAQFAEVYERVAPALCGWVALNLRAGLRARVDAEEVAQEVWLRAWRSLADFDPAHGSFRGWLFGIARNVLLEAFQALQRRRVGSGSTTRLFDLENCPDTVTSATQRVARDDSLQHFIARVRELGEDEQVLVQCCGLEGLGAAEAATRLRITAEAARKRWQRLRASLEELDLPRELLADGAD